ncbi:MAG TPA: response regulator [Candidatus Bathyarchaeia archaeon]|nr:response regulator [Candidatus Bathyarchaeia archaeon]
MKTVLTVDDSKVVRSMVARSLQAYACRVIEAQNGKEGVEAAQQNKPDLILLDVTMPVMDGRQALVALRSDPGCKGIPVIMLTAESGKDLVVEVAKLGITGYIVKPFKQDTFDKEVSKVLGEPGAAAVDASAPIDARAVLVVDDSEKVLAAAAKALEKSMKVLTALSGTEAVKQYAAARPGVVVVDLAMPEMDGYATIAALKKLGQSGFVALAVRGDGGAHEKARKAGYCAVVDKPFQADELLDQVLVAASTVVPVDDLLDTCLGEVEGCAVFSLPRSKVLGRLLPLFSKKLRSIAEEGDDKLILDIAQLNDITSEQIGLLVRLISEAQEIGIRTAICTPDENVLQSLRQVAETREALAAPTPEAARQCLQ